MRIGARACVAWCILAMRQAARCPTLTCDPRSPEGSPRADTHGGLDAAAAFALPWCAALKVSTPWPICACSPALSVCPPRRHCAYAFSVLHPQLPAARPTHLPPAGLRPAALAALAALRHPHAPLALQACVRPGCTLLTFDAVLADDGGGAADDEHNMGTGSGGDGDSRAAAALRAMLAESGAAGAFLRSQSTVHLSLGGGRGGSASAAFGQLLPRRTGPQPPPPPRLPPLTPMALLSTGPGALRLAQSIGHADEPLVAAAAVQAPPGSPPRLACRLHGQYVELQAAPLPGHVAGVPATDAEGVALFDVAPPPDTAGGAGVGARPAAPRPVLLTRDAAIAAEVNGTEASLPTAPAAAALAARASLEAAVIALGHAMRPGCPLQLLARAAAAALHHGWGVASERLVPELAARLAEAEAGGAHGSSDDVAAPRGVTLLHAACASGRPDLAALVVRCGGAAGRLGAPWRSGPGAATPLHVAARALPRPGGDGAVVAARLTSADAAATPAAVEAAARALVAWFSAHDVAGRTPSHLASAPGAPLGLALLDAALRPRLRDGALLARALAAAMLAEEPAAAHLPPAALARRTAAVAQGTALPGQAAAATLAHVSADARAVAAALLCATADGIEERTGGASAAISTAMQM